MEIYNPMLDKEEKKSSKSKMEVLTEFILDELNSYIEDSKRFYRYVSIFNDLLPNIEEGLLDNTIRLSKNLIKSLIVNDVDLFVDSLAGFGTEQVKYMPRETQEKICKDFRLELYKNAEKAFNNK